MKKLSEDIKNGIIKKVYLLHGTQAYLRNQYRDKIVNMVLPDGDRLNYACYEGKNTPVAEVIDLAETMPFLGNYRVIVVENSGFFNESCDELADYIPLIPETTCIVFSEEKINKSYKLYKAVAKHGSVTDFDDVQPQELKQWVMGKLKKEHRNISGQALQMFIDRSGPDMMNISSELEKLISYTFGRDEITVTDIETICTVKFEDKIFDMMEAILRRDRNAAFAYYGDMLSLQKEPEGVLAFLENQLRLLYNCKLFMLDGVENPRDVAQSLEMNEYRVKKALLQARKSSKIWLENSLCYCAEIEEAYKRGNIHKQIGLETVICQLMQTVE